MPIGDTDVAIRRVKEKFEVLEGVFDERQVRLWAAAEARALGRGGSAVVTAATGILAKRIREGARDLEELRKSPPSVSARQQRIRRPGAGRPKLVDLDPALLTALELLVDPVTRGDPESPLRWTSKSKAKLAAELVAQGHTVSETMVGRLLHQLGYSLQSTNKRIEGAQSPDRDAQFEFINA